MPPLPDPTLEQFLPALVAKWTLRQLQQRPFVEDKPLVPANLGKNALKAVKDARYWWPYSQADLTHAGRLAAWTAANPGPLADALEDATLPKPKRAGEIAELVVPWLDEHPPPRLPDTVWIEAPVDERIELEVDCDGAHSWFDGRHHQAAAYHFREIGSGALVEWTTERQPVMEKGERYHLRGWVKAHKVEHGIRRVTVMTRCKATLID